MAIEQKLCLAVTTHSEGGLVNNAADGTQANGSPWRVYCASCTIAGCACTSTSGSPGEGTVGVMFPGTWLGEVGATLPCQWQPGNNHIVIIDKEINGGTINHKGYYAVMDCNITLNDPDQFPSVTLRPIPAPTAVLAGTNVNLSWSAAIQDTSPTGSTNIIGYNVYRSTDGINFGPALNSTPISGTTYTDTTGASGGCYYYAIQLVYRTSNACSSPFTSLYYSDNSNQVCISTAIGTVTATPTASFTFPTPTTTSTIALSCFYAYPNPVLASVNIITFAIAEPTGEETIEIYNIAGTKIATLYNNSPAQGQITWDTAKVSRAVYFCRLLRKGKPICDWLKLAVE